MDALKLRGVLFAILGLASVAAAVRTTRFNFLAIAAGLLFFLLAATSLSNAGRIAASMRHVVGKAVRVQIWGEALPTAGASLIVHSILAASAGLLLFLKAPPDGPRMILKVAQPTSWRLEGGNLEIDAARYVSFRGVKKRKITGKPALSLTIVA